MIARSSRIRLLLLSLFTFLYLLIAVDVPVALADSEMPPPVVAESGGAMSQTANSDSAGGEGSSPEGEIVPQLTDEAGASDTGLDSAPQDEALTSEPETASLPDTSGPPSDSAPAAEPATGEANLPAETLAPPGTETDPGAPQHTETAIPQTTVPASAPPEGEPPGSEEDVLSPDAAPENSPILMDDENSQTTEPASAPQDDDLLASEGEVLLSDADLENSPVLVDGEPPQTTEPGLVPPETESLPQPEIAPQSQFEILQPQIPDPYFYVNGEKHSYLPSGGDCAGAVNCTVSATPIQDAIDSVAGGLIPDDGTIYIEGGEYDENLIIDNLSGLRLLGAANNQPTTLLGEVSIFNSINITLEDILFNHQIFVENSSGVMIDGTDANDHLAIKISDLGGSHVQIDTGDGDDEIEVEGDHGDVEVAGGVGDDILTIDFNGDDSPADLSMIFDGGSGFDAMRVQGGKFDHVIYAATSPHSGIIRLDNADIQYLHIEPIDEFSKSQN